MKWKNPLCSHFGCEDRIYLKEVLQERENLRSERDNLYIQLEKIKLIMEQRDRGIDEMVKEIAKEKGLSDVSAGKISEKIGAVLNTERFSEVVRENIDLRRELSGKEKQNDELRSKVGFLEAEIAHLKRSLDSREEAERKRVGELSGMQDIIRKRESRMDSLNAELDFLEKRKTSMEAVIAKLALSIESMKKQGEAMKKESDYYRQELIHIKKFLSSKVRNVVRLCKKVKRMRDKGRNNYAERVYKELKERYLGLTDVERGECSGQFNEISALME